jgi:cytochrome c biogenesis protein CcmG, thiol:disulfide interchange protein DsbE
VNKVAIRLIFALVLLALGIYLGVRRHNHASSAAGVQVSGETKKLAPAPNFTLTDINGQPLRLADYKGKVVLLDFWATWCAPCRSEIPHFVAWQKQYGPQGLQVIGLSMDDDSKPVPAFMQQFGIDYPVALGDAKLADQYGGVLGLPVTFVIGRDGQIYHKHVGLTDMALLEGEVKQLLEK